MTAKRVIFCGKKMIVCSQVHNRPMTAASYMTGIWPLPAIQSLYDRFQLHDRFHLYDWYLTATWPLPKSVEKTVVSNLLRKKCTVLEYDVNNTKGKVAGDHYMTATVRHCGLWPLPATWRLPAIWPLHDRYQLYNHYMTATWPLPAIWPLYDHYMTDAWPLYFSHMTTAWPIWDYLLEYEL